MSHRTSEARSHCGDLKCITCNEEAEMRDRTETPGARKNLYPVIWLCMTADGNCDFGLYATEEAAIAEAAMMNSRRTAGRNDWAPVRYVAQRGKAKPQAGGTR